MACCLLTCGWRGGDGEDDGGCLEHREGLMNLGQTNSVSLLAIASIHRTLLHEDDEDESSSRKQSLFLFLSMMLCSYSDLYWNKPPAPVPPAQVPSA